jgi:hypothetical protein
VSANVAKGDFKAMLASAKLPEKTVDICLRGDLVAEHEAAERELEQAEKLADVLNSLDGGGNIGDLVDRIEALEAEMREHTYTFRMRALPKPQWRALLAAHPPRKGEDGEPLEQDKYVGVNQETFWDALIRACVVDPEMDEGDWQQLLGEKLNDSQYTDLTGAAWGVNRNDVDIPFSRAASRLKKTSAPE